MSHPRTNPTLLLGVVLWLIADLVLSRSALAKPFAYLPSSQERAITIIDVPSRHVVAGVTLGAVPFDVAIAPDATHVYISSPEAQAVFVLDVDSNVIGDSIDLPFPPGALALTPDGAVLYAGDSTSLPGRVAAIDTRTNEVARIIAYGDPLVGGPSNLIAGRNGERLYISNRFNNHERRPCSLSPVFFCGYTVTAVDTASQAIVGSLAFGADLRGLAVVDRRLFVSNQMPREGSTRGVISVVDTETNLDLATIDLASPVAQEFVLPHPSRNVVFVLGDVGLSVIDTVTHTLISEVPMPRPSAAALTPDGGELWVVSETEVIVLNSSSYQEEARIDLGSVHSAVGDFIGPDKGPCTGDCDDNGRVTVDELVRGVALALALAPSEECHLDRDESGGISIAELLLAVNHALRGCDS